MAGLKKPRGIRHDRHCQRCRTKGIKCDLNRPRCQPCLQSKAACQYPQRVIWMGEKKQKQASPRLQSDPAPSTSTSTSTECSTVQDPRTKHQPTTSNTTPFNVYGFIDLLSQFYHEIQTSQQDLPTETIQLILQTLTFARSRLEGADNNDAIRTHLTALSNLNEVIESAHPIALFGIATFAMFEVCCGSFGHWQRHLQGARSLLDIHCSEKEELDALTERIPGLADVLAYLLWFDVTGALVRGGTLIFSDWHREILSTSFFESVGCPADTFGLFVDLVKGSSDRDILGLCSRAMGQVLHIESDASDRSLAATVYRCAGSIEAFTRAKRNHDRNEPDIHATVTASMVTKMCDAIARMPTTSRFYIHLATPAFLTAVHFTSAQQCEVLRGYWRNCRLCEFPRYPDAEEQCERRWRDGRLPS